MNRPPTKKPRSSTNIPELVIVVDAHELQCVDTDPEASG